MLFLLPLFLVSWGTATYAQLNPDVDSVCREGFVAHRESCYKFFSIKASWPEAVVFCKAFGGQLAEITGAIEQKFVENYMANISHLVSMSMDVWLGASDLLVENEWEWTNSQERLAFTNWMPGEPNNSNWGSSEDCLALAPSAHFEWNDAPCTLKMQFLCEAPMDGKPFG